MPYPHESEDARLDRLLGEIADTAHEAGDEPVTWEELRRVVKAGLRAP